MPAKIEDLILIRKSTSAGVRQHPGGARIRSGWAWLTC